MEQEELQKNIALYYSKLPKETQEVFSSMIWLETLKKISIKYSLNEEQIKTLGTETTLVLLGIVHVIDYEKNLIKEIQIPRATFDEMFLEINDSILKPVLSQITQTFEENTTTPNENLELDQNEELKDTQILKEHGIEIVGQPDLTIPELTTSKEEKTAEIHPILAQKLVMPVKIPSVKTEHGLDNITKTNIPSTTPKIDPYREIPE